MEDEEQESIVLEHIERPGEIIEEPIFRKTIRELRLGTKHRKEEIVQYYCSCGKTITRENAKRCSHCGRLICCGVPYLDEIHCKECLEAHHQISLTKTDYIILFCVSNGVTGTRTIFRLTGVKPNVVEQRINDTMERYVTTESASLLEKLFPKLRLTNLGRDALGVFDSIYGQDTDCVSARERVLKFVEEKTKRSYSLLMEEPKTCSNQ